MGIQIGKENEFPFDKNPKCWYLILYTKNGKIKWDIIINSYKSSLNVLACVCKAILETGQEENVILFGAWHGKHNTDLFLLNPRTTLNILNQRGYPCIWKESLEYWKKELGKN